MTRVPASALMCLCGLHGAYAGASGPFALTATVADFDEYHPTYLANGYWSVASSLRGTDATEAHMVGVMDYTAGDVSRAAAIPSWNEIDYFDGGHWLNEGDVDRRAFAGYRQTLDMRHGELRTRYRWRSGAHSSDLELTAFVSESAPHLAAVSLTVTPRFNGMVRVRFTLRPAPAPRRLPLADMTAEQFAAAASAADRPELAQGGRRDAIWYSGEVGVTAHGADAAARTLWMEGTARGGRRVALGAAIGATALRGVRSTVRQQGDTVVLEVAGRVQAGGHYRFTKFVAASADGWPAEAMPSAAAAAVVASAVGARRRGLASLEAAHAAAFNALWAADIRVGGNAQLQRTLHSDLFYLLENSTEDTGWPAAACGFSANYFGHVFWDNDLWVFPALLLLHPERARSLIAFRERTLPQARARAAAHGFAGAMFPWEADPASGDDVTPRFAVQNADREIHVNGAVALAQWQYFLASGDRGWLRQHGYPVIEAVADFWASRVTRDPASGHYELKDVTSPEEDYTHVDNEIYTNVVAQASLRAALDAATVLGLPPGARWREVADGLYLPTTARDGRYHDFDPSTPHDKTTSWMATSVPMLFIPALDFDADAATLHGLFQHSVQAIAPVRGRANQMVLVMLAIQAAAAGDPAYFGGLIGGRSAAADPFLKPPFNVRSETPQNDTTYLLATSGGFVQAFIYGLTGLRIDAAGLAARFPPLLPRPLTYLELRGMESRGRRFDVRISRLPSGEIARHMVARDGGR